MTRRVVLEFDNIQMIKEAVSIGSGLSILPKERCARRASEGRLVALPIEADGLVRPVGIIHRRKKKFTPMTAVFLSFLKDHPEE